jgi:hypothetical protein
MRIGRLIDGTLDTGWSRVLWIVDEFSDPGTKTINWSECKWGTQLYGHRFDLIVINRVPRNARELDWYHDSVRCRLAPNGKIVHIGLVTD